jgi:hypothetical protein
LAKRKSHDDGIKRGLAALRSSGIDPEKVSPASISRLEEHLGKGRDVDLAVIFILGKIADPAALPVLTRLEEEAGDKEIKREVRRSFFKLAQKGISAPRREGASPGDRKPVFGFAPEIEGYMSSVDGGGGRLVWLVKSQAGSGLQLIQGMVSDREGLRQVGGATVRRKELRAMIQEIKERHGVTMISIPWEYGDRILYEAQEQAKALGRSGTENFSSLRAAFTIGRPKKSEHPIYDLMNLEGATAGAWRELSRRLLDEPELRPWILDEDWIRPYLQEMQEAQGSRLVLNPVQKEERLAGIVRDTVKALFSGETGNLLQRRMEDMALYFFETGRVDKANLALAVALQLKEGEPGALDISFSTGLVQKSFAFYASQEKGKLEEEHSLIVKP